MAQERRTGAEAKKGASETASSATRTAGCGAIVVRKRSLGFSSRAFYLQNAHFSKWRDPDSNRGHHDFQICPEIDG